MRKKGTELVFGAAAQKGPRREVKRMVKVLVVLGTQPEAIKMCPQ